MRAALHYTGMIFDNSTIIPTLYKTIVKNTANSSTSGSSGVIIGGSNNANIHHSFGGGGGSMIMLCYEKCDPLSTFMARYR